MATDMLNSAARTDLDPGRVLQFDIYHDSRFEPELHDGFRKVQDEAPDFFYTPCNGGHWVATRWDLCSRILQDSDHFSTKNMDIPNTHSDYVMIPLNLDPPDHAPYRAALMQWFTPRSVAAMTPRLEAWADRLVDRIAADGEGDLAQLAAAFPVSVFMELMGLPMDRFDDFRTIVVEYFDHISGERRLELQALIFAEMTEVIEARQASSADDMTSKLVDLEIKGRRLSMEELQSIMFLLFQAGLDTVANAMTFALRHLAQDQALQDRLIANPDDAMAFVEEAIRRYGSNNTSRQVKSPVQIEGVNLKAGEMIFCALPAGGLDERVNPDPMTFDIDRPERHSMVFSVGAHMCIGQFLARTEMAVLTRAWLRRVGRFRLKSGFKPDFRAGLVMALKSLPAVWTPA